MMQTEPGGSITELGNLPPEEWERFRPVQIPFGLFGLDRILFNRTEGVVVTPAVLTMQMVLRSLGVL